MKTLAIIFSIVGIITLNSCSPKTDTSAILENSETRIEMFTAIADNHDYMTEFMENTQNSEHGMQMMEGNQNMMGNSEMPAMMKDSLMMRNLMGNKEMMHSMMGEMMQNGEMMASMIKMMNENGLMSEECTKSCTKLMIDKGLDMEGMTEIK